MIPADFIDELLAKTDIVDIVGQHVPLKKSGANYMACCPFHKEKSPSFSVSHSKQFYHCFGCGAHGSAIGFVMQHQGLGFVEAVQYLADRIGLNVPRTHGSLPENQQQRQQRKQQQQTLEQTVQAAADFYRQQLAQSAPAQAYLQQRGLNPDIIQRYGLGYAPSGWQALAQIFQPYPSAALIDGGMVIDQDGKQYDRFRHRIMFPIRHSNGHIIGFGGRVLDDSKPKYLNSPDTPLFDKGKNLYGLYEARQAVREAGRILVVEGYMDVVALAQAGIAYAVAALGTATTAEHIKLLMRQSDHIYFCFDGDTAGRKAAWRALENALPQLQDDKTLHFLFLPEQHDPDSYVRAHGKTVFEDALLHQSQTLSAYFWQGLNADTGTPEGRAQLVRQAAPLLQQITRAPALAFLLRQELSERSGIDPANLARLLGQPAPARAPVTARRHNLPEHTFRQPETLTLAQKQIRSLLLHPEWAADAVLPDHLPLENEHACLNALAAFYRQHPAAALAQTTEHFRHSPFSALIDRLSAQAMQSEPPPYIQQQDNEKKSFQDGMRKLAAELNNRQINLLKHKNSTVGLNAQEKTLLLQLLTAAR